MNISGTAISGTNGVLAGASLQADPGRKTQKAADSAGGGFLERLREMAGTAGGVSGEKTDISGTDAYQNYLKQRYGNVMIQDVGKDQRSMDRLGAGTTGMGNVVIAPNILEQMAGDPGKAAYYEGKIQHYFASAPHYAAQLSAMGHEVWSSGIVIHSDGTVTHYICGDLKPEVRARIEAQIRAEEAAKAKRKREYQRRQEEAAEARRIVICG